MRSGHGILTNEEDVKLGGCMEWNVLEENTAGLLDAFKGVARTADLIDLL